MVSSIKWYQSPRLVHGRNSAGALTRRYWQKDEEKSLAIKRDFVFKKGAWNKNKDDICLEIEQRQESFKAKQLTHKMKRARCYLCKQKGHAYWNCQNKGIAVKAKGKKHMESDSKEIKGDSMVLGTDSNNWDLIWYVSKTSSKHIASKMNVFINYKSVENKEKGCHTHSDIIGEALVATKDHDFVIPCVTYVPKLGINILSLSQLTVQGFEVEFLENRCVIKHMFEDTSSKRTSDETRNEESIDMGSIQEELDEIERNVAIDITKKMLSGYVSRKCDRIGDSSIKGFYNDNFGEEMVIPSNLKIIIEFVDQILLGKFAENMKDTYSSNFDKMVLWFYKEFLDCSHTKNIPPTIGNKQISLMDLFRKIKEMGGAGNILVKGKWDCVAKALGYPKKYAAKIEECYLENLQQLDVHYDVAKKFLEEVEKEYVVWKGMKRKLEVNSFEGYMTFMGILKHAPTAMKYKDLLKRKIQDVVNWFHKGYMNCVFDAPMPPKIGNVEVCLFDLFELVEGMGGSEQISERNQWDIVAMSFGFSACLENKLQGIFQRYLELLDSFYRTVMEERTAMKEGRNEDAVKDTYTAGNIDKIDEVDGRNNNMVPGEDESEEGKDEAQEKLMNEETNIGSQELLNYDHANIVYDDGERIVITFEEEAGSSKESSIEEYCNSEDEDECVILNSK